MRRSRMVALLALAVAGALVTQACGSSSSPDTGNTTSTAGTQSSDSDAGEAAPAAPRGTLNLAWRDGITSWDPAQAHISDFMDIYQAAYDTLLLREPDGTFSPMLATKWEYNSDNTELTLTLREDVTFNDGAPFNAEAVVANFDHFKSSNGPDVKTVVSVESVQATGPYEVTYKLSEPDPSMLYQLSMAAGLQASPKALDDKSLATDPVGTGPYVLDVSATNPGRLYVLTAKQNYWNPDIQHYDKVVFQVLEDPSARLNSILSGQADAGLIDSTMLQTVKDAKLQVLEYPADMLVMVMYDREGKLLKPLADVKVRQAINYAIDRKAIVSGIYDNEAEATSQVFSPTVDAFQANLEDAYPYDPAKAKELMAEAGYADGFDVTIPISSGSLTSVRPVITSQFGAIGIKVTWNDLPTYGEFVNDVAAAKHPMALMSLFQGETWLQAGLIIRPTAIYNPFHSSTPETQKELDQIKNGDDAANAAHSLNKYLVDQAWFAPIARLNTLMAHSATLDVVASARQVVPSLYNFKPSGS